MNINPRYAAFMASWGRDAREVGSFANAKNNADFMAFIARAKASAPAEAREGDLIINHDAFTAHCWNVARDDLLQRFPAQ